MRTELANPDPAGDHWCGRTVAAWIGERLGRSVCRQTGWSYLRRIGTRWRMPRPRHVHADAAAQLDFKARLRPLLRQVAMAYPHAAIELWAMDEHHIGLKPLLRKAWTFDQQRPLAPVQHRFAWRYLVGFVHPALRGGTGRIRAPDGSRTRQQIVLVLEHPRVGPVERPAAATDQPGTVRELMDDQASRMFVPRAPPVAYGTTRRLVSNVAPPRRGDARVVQILTGEIALAVVTDPHPVVRVSLLGSTRPTHWSEPLTARDELL